MKHTVMADLGILGRQEVVVDATWLRYFPATLEQPEEGGYYEIEQVWLDGLDVTDYIEDFRSLEEELPYGDEYCD